MSLYANAATILFLFITLTEREMILPLTLIFGTISFAAGLSSIYLVNYLRTSDYLFRKYEIESTTDFLTGLSNLRSFETSFNYYSTRAKQKDTSLSILMLDIDHLKKINDTYGHGAGDFVLGEISSVMQEALGKKGTVYRKGGEEFAILLPAYDNQIAYDTAERVRKEVENNFFKVSEDLIIQVTISIGLATFPASTSSIDHLIEEADQALYKAKDSGRNKVVTESLL